MGPSRSRALVDKRQSPTIFEQVTWRLWMSSRRAVLWDMDGTLIDSQEYHWISWRDALFAEGITITHDQFLSTFGQRNDSILTQWLGTPSRHLIEKIGNTKEEIYRKLVRERGIEPLPGVAKWVRHLARTRMAAGHSVGRATQEHRSRSRRAVSCASLSGNCFRRRREPREAGSRGVSQGSRSS